jgi:uncharacterized protein (DUF2147 family)
MMRKLFAIAAFVLASSAAQAQYTFDYGGRTIRIDPDRGTVSIPGVYDNTGRKNRSHDDADYDRPRKQTPGQAKIDSQTPAAAPAEQAPAPSNASSAPATANVAPADAPAAQPLAVVPAQDPAPAARPTSPPVVATAPAQKQQVPAAQSATSPLGVWLTEEKEGKIRIEQCGANLCGYSVDAKTNQNGKQVLINMKPGGDKWSGRIFDPNSGSTYDSTIALKGSDALRVQGCAFGGMFCGGQTWSRLN